MPRKKKAKVSKRDKSHAQKTKADKDMLGCYRKNMKKGVYVCQVLVSDVPVRLKRRYSSAIEMNGDTSRRAFMLFMDNYAAEVEKKFNTFLDPEFPEDYDPTH
jgi:hypothetical protein